MTTYTGPWLGLVFNGYLAGGQDIWSCGLSLAPLQIFTGGNEPGQSLVQAGYDEWASAIFGDAADEFASSTVLTGASLYYHATSAAPASIEWAAVTADPQPSGSSSSALPSECAVVCSTLTGFPGRSKRGRFYLPGLAPHVLASSGFLGTEEVTTLLSACQAVVQALNAVEAGGDPVAEVVVRSAVLGSYTTVNALKMGNVMDSQRRRRNAIIEDYQTASL